MPASVCIISGGMDSALAAAITLQSGREVIAVHFDYNQRTETREKKAFRDLCDFYRVTRRYEIDLKFFEQIGASALTDRAIAVPEQFGSGVAVTYVPFRNGIFLSVAAAIAEKEGADQIVIGAVEEDSSGYPDCRESFLNALQNAINLGTKEETNIRIAAPLVHLKKEQIVAEAARRGVPLNLTWSCYQSEDKACGVCESCRLRLKGFEKAGKKDPIPYR